MSLCVFAVPEIAVYRIFVPDFSLRYNHHGSDKLIHLKSQPKRKLVEATYDIIVEQGIETVTSREVARRVNVTATMIYKHFESLNYLIVVASIRYITDYLEELEMISMQESNPVEMNLLG